jgi:hypothetical protein
LTWLLLRTPAGTALVEHHALVSTTDQVISRHDDYRDAAAALVAYRDREAREAAIAAGQRSLFGGGDAA